MIIVQSKEVRDPISYLWPISTITAHPFLTSLTLPREHSIFIRYMDKTECIFSIVCIFGTLQICIKLTYYYPILCNIIIPFYVISSDYALIYTVLWFILCFWFILPRLLMPVNSCIAYIWKNQGLQWIWIICKHLSLHTSLTLIFQANNSQQISKEILCSKEQCHLLEKHVTGFRGLLVATGPLGWSLTIFFLTVCFWKSCAGSHFYNTSYLCYMLSLFLF